MTSYGKVLYKSKCGKTNYQKMGFLIKYSTKTISKYYHISIQNGTKNRGVRYRPSDFGTPSTRTSQTIYKSLRYKNE